MWRLSACGVKLLQGSAHYMINTGVAVSGKQCRRPYRLLSLGHVKRTQAVCSVACGKNCMSLMSGSYVSGFHHKMDKRKSFVFPDIIEIASLEGLMLWCPD